MQDNTATESQRAMIHSPLPPYSEGAGKFLQGREKRWGDLTRRCAPPSPCGRGNDAATCPRP